MIINFESELMKNQKHAEVMAPDRAFEVLQTQDGDSLFFSIGTDDVFYLTREVRGANTGWDRIDLSSGLSGQLRSAKVTTKGFCVSQNAATGNIDLMLAVTDGIRDSLFVSTGHSNGDLAWADGVTWTYLPFDAVDETVGRLAIADLSILQNTSGEFFVVDILKDPANPLKLIRRYFITPDGAVKWRAHALPFDMSADTIVTALGQRSDEMVAGTYTFGKIGGTQEMIFTQLYNPWEEIGPKNQSGYTARLAVPAGASAMAVATGPGGDSALFLAGNGVLTVFTSNNQEDGAQGTAAVSDPMFAGVLALRAATTQGRTAVWAINQQGNLFSTSCVAGTEGTPSAWSTPLPISFNVEGMAFFLNAQQNNSVIFAHVDGANLIQLTQDPVTTEWQRRSVLLPSTAPDDMLSYNSFTTHVSVVDEYNAPQADVALSVMAGSPVTVYANHVYHVLSPTVPVVLTTDATGILTLVQETTALSAVPYTLAIGTAVSAAIDPMSKLLGTLNTIQSGSDLAKVKVKDEKGNERSLVGAGVTADQKTAAAETLKQFMQVAAKLPVTRAPPVAVRAAPAVHPGRATPQAAFNLTFDQSKWNHSGTVAPAGRAAAAAQPVAADDTLGDLGSAISVAAGDFFNWVKRAFDDVVGFTIRVVDDVHHFFVKLGDKIYHLVLDTVAVVVHAVELVFNKIAVFFEDLIAWLGFLFEWQDIRRTKKVIKNLLKVYTIDAVHQIKNAGDRFKTLIKGLETKVDAWAGLSVEGDTIGTTQKNLSPAPGQNSPQSNWGTHHLSGNMDQLDIAHPEPSSGPLGTLKTVLDDFEKLIADESAACQTAFARLKHEVVDVRASLTPGDLMKRLTAILLDLLLTSAADMLATGLDIVAALLEGLIELLDAPIKIPIISAVYRAAVGDDLSLLDLTCLVCAIPVTIIYKLENDRAPFPQEELTDRMIGAPDLATFRDIVRGTGPQPRSKAVASGPGPHPQQAQMQQAQPTVPSGTANIISWALSLTAAFAAIPVIIIAVQKRKRGDATPQWLNRLAFAAYLPYIAPNIPASFGDDRGEWYTIVNDAVTGFSIGKVFLDALQYLQNGVWSKIISPWLEMAINIVWLVPACGAIAAGPGVVSNRLGFVANAFFDIGGTLTPATVKEIQALTNPETAEASAQVFFVLSQIGAGLYAIFCWAYARRLAFENP